MFTKRNGKSGLISLREAFEKSDLKDRLNKGMKYSERQMEDFLDSLEKNPRLANVKHRVEKEPVMSATALLGIGLAAFSLFRLFRK